MNDRFIELLTKEFSDILTDGERHELNWLIENNEGFSEQREILKDYWKRDTAEYTTNTALFKKIAEKIRAEEFALQDDSADDQIYYKKRLLKTWHAAAAAILVVMSIFSYHYLTVLKPGKASLTSVWEQKTTRKGIKSIITLVDGTIITLNSATNLKFPSSFDGKTREVYLDGEAYFDVHKDHEHPFIIHTNKMNIRVLGTSFNVKSYRNDASSETTLIRGSIEVTLNDRPSDRIILKPREKLIVQNNTFTKTQTNLTAASTAIGDINKGTRYALTNLTYYPNHDTTVVETSWVHNKLVFSNKDFIQLSTQLERWYGVKIQFQDDHVKEYRFTGMFEKETLPQTLDALKMIEHFKYKITDSTVYIY